MGIVKQVQRIWGTHLRLHLVRGFDLGRLAPGQTLLLSVALVRGFDLGLDAPYQAGGGGSTVM